VVAHARFSITSSQGNLGADPGGFLGAFAWGQREGGGQR
jgi:hypothetical protein